MDLWEEVWGVKSYVAESVASQKTKENELYLLLKTDIKQI